MLQSAIRGRTLPTTFYSALGSFELHDMTAVTLKCCSSSSITGLPGERIARGGRFKFAVEIS